MSEEIIIKHALKKYGDNVIIPDLSLDIREGEFFTLLGPSGCGKTTLLRIIAGLEYADSGTIHVGERDLTPIPVEKRNIGVVFQNSVLDKALTVRDNLQSRAALYGITGKEFKKRLAELASLLDFENLLNRTVGKLSGGQRRRIDIARAILHKPELLILDEPTTGLDPQTRKLLWDVVRNLRRTDGMTVLLTTHYMEEAADADYVVIIDSGKISAEGTPLELKNKYTGDFITLYGVSEDNINNLGLPFEKIRDAVRVSVPDTRAATQLILEHPELFSDYEITKGKMDDVFLAVTGKKPEGGENR